MLSGVGDSAREEGAEARVLRLVHSSREVRKPVSPDAGLKEMLDEMRRDRAGSEAAESGPDGEDAA